MSTVANEPSIEWKRPETVWWNTRPGLTLNRSALDRRAEMDSTRRCSVEGCHLKYRASGYCWKHLAEIRTSGISPVDRRLRVNRGPLADLPCRVDGCKRPSRYRGQRLCGLHYQRLRNTGSFDLHVPTRRERFDANIASRDGCWIWSGTIADTGYGRMDREYAHRVSYEIYKGPIPEGYQIDHLCRVRSCVNPAHLEAVTQQENIRREAAARGNRCRFGHSMEDAMLVHRSTGRITRQCRECYAIRTGRSR